MTYLFFDTETGGLDPAEHSLLTAHFALVDTGTLAVINELSLAIRPREGYSVTPSALKVNRIDLAAHWERAVPAPEAADQLRAFLPTNAAFDPVTPVGWNCAFDIGFVKQQLLSDWETFVSYRTLDLQSAVRFLSDAGVLPPMKGLAAAADYFKIDRSGHHDAAFDTRLTLAVFREVRGMLVGPARGWPRMFAQVP